MGLMMVIAESVAAPSVYWRSEDGRASLMVGDCLEIMSSMPDGSVDCVWTDPPYNLSNDGITCVSGRMVKVNKGNWDKSRGLEMDHEFNLAWLAECFRVLKPSGTIWVSGTAHVYLSVGFALQQVGFRILNDIVWEKPAPPPNLGCRTFTHSTELLLWATKAPKGKNLYTFNYDAMKEENGGKQMKSVWRMSPPSSHEKRYGKHPTQKPVDLVARCIRASTNRGELVLDPFNGSGTTGVAAIQEGRAYLGCDLSADYLAISRSRLKDAVAERRLELWNV